MTPYILVIDAGTTGIRALVYNDRSHILSQSYSEFPKYHPTSECVEQDANEIWATTRKMIDSALAQLNIKFSDITCIGIANQRATTVVWDKKSGQPLSRAIVWQDTRTANRVKELKPHWGEKVYERTGWALSPVYSSLSLEWLLNNVDGLREKAEAGELAFGTIDSWLVYKFTGGQTHVISASNASVTGSYDLIEDQWYEEWLNELNVPASMFPTVCDDSGIAGYTDEATFGSSVPISGIIADQHAALFSQGCIEPGMIKCTHGTGTFLDMTIGEKPIVDTKSGICCQIAWRKNGKTHYALEGYVSSTGAAIQWLRDGLEIIDSSAESMVVASQVQDTGGVYFVPALTGLSAPYWDPCARGTIFGISPGTTRSHVVRATLEAIVYSVRDFLQTMESISGFNIKSIAVDGGASKNDLLLQFQADQLGVDVIRPRNVEATALGAALMAGLGVNLWSDEYTSFPIERNKKTFQPHMSEKEKEEKYEMWKRAVERSREWSKK
ncbi:glycerol kinase 2 [Pectobacterium carotovorum subsp. carotovorum]|nr:glycerol kinase 2 [Pectobacterium carotovorum subsp. carotovorum]